MLFLPSLMPPILSGQIQVPEVVRMPGVVDGLLVVDVVGHSHGLLARDAVVEGS